jgi:hypothetical protein
MQYAKRLVPSQHSSHNDAALLPSYESGRPASRGTSSRAQPRPRLAPAEARAPRPPIVLLASGRGTPETRSARSVHSPRGVGEGRAQASADRQGRRSVEALLQGAPRAHGRIRGGALDEHQTRFWWRGRVLTVGASLLAGHLANDLKDGSHPIRAEIWTAELVIKPEVIQTQEGDIHLVDAMD